jgi:hypothetical protein
VLRQAGVSALDGLYADLLVDVVERQTPVGSETAVETETPVASETLPESVALGAERPTSHREDTHILSSVTINAEPARQDALAARRLRFVGVASPDRFGLAARAAREFPVLWCSSPCDLKLWLLATLLSAGRVCRRE